MTAENQNIETKIETENETEKVYRGPKWGIGKIIGFLAIICATMAIRNICMVFVYGSIYGRTIEDSYDMKIGFLNYVFMILLFAIP
ncbi:MAG: hypothetical protein IJW38_04385, partial [Clostridia bacterium]|nr:hypothetical protein [Clostridia bacterium]